MDCVCQFTNSKWRVVVASVCVAWLTFVLPCMCCQNPEQGEWLPEDRDYSDDYMYHTVRRDHTRVFHQKKQYPQNILFKVDYGSVHVLVTLTSLWLLHLMGFGSLLLYLLLINRYTTTLLYIIYCSNILPSFKCSPKDIISFTLVYIIQAKSIFRPHQSF